MEQDFAIQLFENKKIRCVWDAEREKYYSPSWMWFRCC